MKGGLTDEELSNIAHSLIHNIANLQGHLQKWARQNEKEVSNVNKAFSNSNELKIIQDLSNNDKHGYPPRDGGHSGIAPKIKQFTRGMQLTTPEGGGTLALAFDAKGKPRVIGKGDAAVVISGEIIDRDGNTAGNLHSIAKKAISDWEDLLKEFGLKV